MRAIYQIARSYWFGFFLILIVGIGIFWPTFLMSLYGDEWQMLWFGKAVILNKYQILPTDIWNAYWNEMIVFNLISNLFGFQGVYYYVFSFFCRFLAALSIYWFVNKNFQSRRLALLASVLFMISPVGIEATDWVRNFDSYLGIIFFLLGVDVVIKLKNTTAVLWLILFFLVGILVNPLRSHGIFLTYQSLLAVRCIQFIAVGNKQSLIRSVITSLLLAGIFYLMVLLNVFGGLSGNGFFGVGFNLPKSLESGFYSFGNMFVPNYFSSFFPFQFFQFWLLSFLMIFIISVSFKKKIKIVLWTMYLLSAGLIGYQIFLYPQTAKISIMIGFYFLACLTLLILLFFKKKMSDKVINLTLIMSLIVNFMIYPLLRQSGFQASFEHRYLIYSALVIPFLVIFLISSIKPANTKIRIINGLLVGFILVINALISFNYLITAQKKHSASDCQSLRQQVFDHLDNVTFENQKFFWFKTTFADEESKTYDCLTFGFMFNMGLHYQIWDQNRLPIAVYETREGIESMLTNGQTTAKYIGYNKKIDLKDLYIFEITKGVVVPRQPDF